MDKENIDYQIELENLAKQNCIINVVGGSHAYGTNMPTSDWDERGIFVDKSERIILPFDKIEQVTFTKDDVVYFELSKYMPLLLEQNPNVLELIWTDKKDILHITEQGQYLIDNRKDFLSIKIKDSYVGYANGQLKRIKGHNKWINNPQPEREPQQQDFMSVVYNYSGIKELNKHVPTSGYTAVSLGNNMYSLWSNSNISRAENKSWIDTRGNPIALTNKEMEEINKTNKAPDMIVKINTSVFESNHENWKMFWKWKKNRNEKRSELEEKYGYDTKHAMHLIRLLRSGADILEHGIVPVKRNDAQYLLDIRNGIYTYEEIIAESNRLTEKVNELSLKTKLPIEPNRDLAKEIMLQIYKDVWKLENTNKLNSNSCPKY